MSFASSFEAIAARYGQEVILLHNGSEIGRGRAVLRPVLNRQSQWLPSQLGNQRWEKVLCLAQSAIPFLTGPEEQTVQAGKQQYNVVNVRPVEAGQERIYWRVVLQRREEDAL